MKINLNWLRDYIDLELDPDRTARELTMAGLEVEGTEQFEGEQVLELSVTPNRPDWLSHLGVARELAAIHRCPLKPPPTALEEGEMPVEAMTSVEVEDPEGCPRYSARVITGVGHASAPDWVARRLESVGVRSIDAVVDASNYVMMEMGQPLHTFDYDQLKENRIVVKRAGDIDSFTTLDGQERSLVPDDLLICDGLGPVAVAGVMGGENSEVGAGTTNLLLESACFNPVFIRRTARRMGMSTEASYRFERGTDPSGTVAAVDRLALLIREWAGGEICRGVVDCHPRPEGEGRVEFRPARLEAYLGMPLAPEEVEAILLSLGMRTEEAGEGILRVTVPGYRRDMAFEEDVIEEVIRIHGYDTVPVTMPRGITVPVEFDRRHAGEKRVREAMEAQGFSEAICYSFISPEDMEAARLAPEGETLRLMNPLSEEMSVMRPTLLPGLLRSLALNLSRRAEDVRLYEMGRVFDARGGADGLPLEQHRLAAVITGSRSPKSWYREAEEADFYDLKGAVEGLLDRLGIGGAVFAQSEAPHLQPGQAATLTVEGTVLGTLGTVHPEVRSGYGVRAWAGCVELELDRLLELACDRPRYAPLPRYPALLRDLALVVPDSVSNSRVEEVVRSAAGELAGVALFDSYRGKGVEDGCRSLAYSLSFQSGERTLTDQEVDTSLEAVVSALERELGVRRR